MSPSPSSAATVRDRGGSALIALFFVSGAASLVYETVWNRLLVLQMGNTAYALTTVLTVFMGGLALGGYLGGRIAPRLRNPLRTYGWLELGIGVTCAAVPSLIGGLEPVMQHVYNHYSSSLITFSFFQFLLCGAVLLLPVTAMGATLPIVAEFVAQGRRGVSRSVGLAYGVNTFGGFAGVMIGGFALIPTLGLHHSNLVAACLSSCAGLVALALAPRFGASAGEDAASGSRSAALTPESRFVIPPQLLLIGLGISGFAAMSYQVAWTRVLTLAIGSVTYSFPLIVGAFIGGLALGAAAIGPLGDRPGRCTPLLVLAQLGIAVVAAATIPALGDLPVQMTLTVLRHSDSFVDLQIAKFGAVFLIVFVPTFLMGGMLPLAVRAIAAAERSSVGPALGRAYASNTLGTIVGAFAAGFLLVPTIGMQQTIAAAVTLNAAVAALFLLGSGFFALPVRIGLAFSGTAGLAFLAFSLPGWDRAIMTSAPYLHAPLYAEGPASDAAEVRSSLARKARIIYYREDVATTVTVLDDGKSRYLYVGGKLDALSKSPSQSLLGHLPMLLHPKARRVLVVGLGSSETLAATLSHPSLEQVDCVEISPAVVEAAGKFFQPESQPLRDSRLTLRMGDGRVHMAMTDRSYDVIVSQPGNPWMAGASALFTREYFEQMKARLAPGGVVSVWVQGFSASPESVQALVGTFVSVFEHADLWETRVPGDFILTGTLEPLHFDILALDDAVRAAAVAPGLAEVSIVDAADLLGYFITTGEAAMGLPGAGEWNSDDHNFLELRLQRELLMQRELDVLTAFSSVRKNPATRLAAGSRFPGSRTRELQSRIDRIYRSKPIARAAQAMLAEQRRMQQAGDPRRAASAGTRFETLRRQLAALNPRDPLVVGY